MATALLAPDLVQPVLLPKKVLHPHVVCVMPCHPCCSSVPLLHVHT